MSTHDAHELHDADDQNKLQRSRSAATLRDEHDEFEGVITDTGVATAGVGSRLGNLEKVGSHSDGDTLIVDWDGPDDPQNPKK